MAIDLLKLVARFEVVSDKETAHAHFRTLVPSVAPFGYLNIIFKPQAPEVIRAVDAELGLPQSLREFFAAWNGARLFFSALSIRGCLPSGHLLNRTDPFALLPFDLREADRDLARRLDREGMLRIGTYGRDGSVVSMRRDSGCVCCHVGGDTTRIRCEWPTLEDWLSNEVVRLSLFFDTKGNCLISDDGLFLPGGERGTH